MVQTVMLYATRFYSKESMIALYVFYTHCVLRHIKIGHYRNYNDKILKITSTFSIIQNSSIYEYLNIYMVAYQQCSDFSGSWLWHKQCLGIFSYVSKSADNTTSATRPRR